MADQFREITNERWVALRERMGQMEHLLFSFISMEWAEHPPRSLELMLDYICGRTIVARLRVNAFLDSRSHVKGLNVSKLQFKIGLKRHEVSPSWNYRIPPCDH